jgi:hypothetical protein
MDGAGTACAVGARPWWTITVVHNDGSAAPAVQAAADFEALDDRALVRACLGGQREAFDEIVVRHRRSVYHLCHRFVGSHEDATDLTQDVFLRAYRALGSF